MDSEMETLGISSTVNRDTWGCITPTVENQMGKSLNMYTEFI